MRKLETQEERDRRRGRTNRIIGIVFIVLLLFSTAGFALYSRSDTAATTSGDGSGQYNGQYWVYGTSTQQYYFTNSYEQVKDISIPGEINLATFAGKPLFIAAESEAIINEISINLQRYVPRIQQACYGPCEGNLPEKTCDSTTENLIVFRVNDVPTVRKEGSCVFVDGSLATVDALLYKTVGIKEEI